MEQSNQGFIYSITSPTGKVYVGQTKNIKNRERSYRGCKCKTQPKLYNSIKKYGWDVHIFEIIDKCSIFPDKTELDEKEKYWIKFYDSHHNGLNCNDGGQGHLGRKQSLEHIAKRVEFLKLKGRGKGKEISEETIKKRLETKKINGTGKGINLGRKQSKETIAKRIATMIKNKTTRKGIPKTKEHKEKLRQGNLGKKKNKKLSI